MVSDAAPAPAKIHAAAALAATDPDGLEPAGPASSAEQEGEDLQASDDSSSSMPGNANPSEGCNWDVLWPDVSFQHEELSL